MLPFTREQFVAVFAVYNTAVWPAQWVAYGLASAIIVALMRPSRWSGRAIGWALALMWIWTGIVYHAVFFSAINKAAPVFGALFVVQGLLFAHASLRNDLHFGVGHGLSAWLGWALVVYAAVMYPLLGVAAGHGYPAMPLFGITPCPVVLFTLGLLLLVTGPLPRRLLGVPFLWALIGGSAAFLLAVPQDWPLLLSGLLVVPMLWRHRANARTGPTTVST